MKQRIEILSQHKGFPADLIALHGTQATRLELLEIVRDVFRENDNIRPEDYLRSTDEHIYAAARGVARIAKQDMWDDFIYCIPLDHCSISEHMPSGLRWHRMSEEELVAKQAF